MLLDVVEIILDAAGTGLLFVCTMILPVGNAGQLGTVESIVKMNNYKNMKKYDSILLILGSLLSLIPIYPKLGWIYICVFHPNSKIPELTEMYNSVVLFNHFNSKYFDSIFIIICGLISCSLLYLSYLNGINKNKNSFCTKTKAIILYTSAAFTFWEIFGLM